MTHRVHPRRLLFVMMAAGTTIGAARADEPRAGVLTGREALGDWTTDAPGVKRLITPNDLAKPFDTPSANNFPRLARRPSVGSPGTELEFAL